MADNIISGGENNYGIPYESLGKYFLTLLKNRNADDVVIVDGITEDKITCSKLIEDGVKFARLLKSLGAQKGDVCAVVSENNIQFSTLMLGAFCSGVVLNPLNPDYMLNELKHAFSLSKPKVIISSTNALKNVQEAVNQLFLDCKILLWGEVDNTDKLERLENVLDETVADVDNFELEEFDIAEQGAVILMSSGTTGLPKAVLLTQLNLQLVLGYFRDPDYFDAANKTSLQVVPNNHAIGFLMQIQSLANAMKIILLNKFKPDLFLGCIQKYKVNFMLTVPSVLLFLVKSQAVDKYDLSSLRDIAVGAAPVGRELQKEAKLKYKNLTVREVYGATETAGACTVQTFKRNKPGSSGILIPGMTAKIYDVATNKALGPGEVGELCFKGPQIMKKYLRNSAETKQSFDEDGFYHTGDLGYYDEDHFVFIVDRIKELIKYKGFQVPPAELETLIISNPKVKDCGVVGIPDERAGQLPLAFVVKQPNTQITEKEIIDFVAERISVQKRLYGGVYFTEEIPRNQNGKIVRKELIKLLV